MHHGISFQKLKLSHVTDFLYNYGTRLLITMEVILTNCYHETIYHIYPNSNFNVTYPLISSSDHAANTVVTTDLCFTQLLIGHLKHAAWLIFQGIGLLLTSWWTLQVFVIPYEGHLPLCLPIAIWICLCWCAVWQQCIPRNVEILTKPWWWQNSILNAHISEHVWTMSILVSDIVNLTLTEVQL